MRQNGHSSICPRNIPHEFLGSGREPTWERETKVENLRFKWTEGSSVIDPGEFENPYHMPHCFWD